MVFFFCIPCLFLIAYFGILGIFVPKYRGYVRNAVRCFIDKLSGKECSVSFDERMRMKFSAWLLDRDYRRAGKFFNSKKNFTIAFTIVFILFSVVSAYLFILLIQFIFIQSPCEIGSCGI